MACHVPFSLLTLHYCNFFAGNVAILCLIWTITSFMDVRTLESIIMYTLLLCLPNHLICHQSDLPLPSLPTNYSSQITPLSPITLPSHKTLLFYLLSHFLDP